MRKSDEQRAARTVLDNVQATVPDTALSKTRRKAAMHALQDLGEMVVALDAREFASLRAQVEIPEPLLDAIVAARKITAHGGRKRQLQYVGKLMREVDPAPIAKWLDARAQGRQYDAARLHAVERWRERLLDDGEGLDALAALHPALDRPHFRALIAKARAERASGAAPHAYRDLFRALKALMNDTGGHAPT